MVPSPAASDPAFLAGDELRGADLQGQARAHLDGNTGRVREGVRDLRSSTSECRPKTDPTGRSAFRGGDVPSTGPLVWQSAPRGGREGSTPAGKGGRGERA